MWKSLGNLQEEFAPFATLRGSSTGEGQRAAEAHKGVVLQSAGRDASRIAPAFWVPFGRCCRPQRGCYNLRARCPKGDAIPQGDDVPKGDAIRAR